MENPAAFLQKLEKFLQEELKVHINSEHDFREPLNNPVAFYLAFMPLKE